MVEMDAKVQTVINEKRSDSEWFFYSFAFTLNEIQLFFISK
jgi:hypothetical protein